MVGEATAMLGSVGMVVVTNANNVASVGGYRAGCVYVCMYVCVRKIDKWTRGNSQWSIERRIKVGKYYLVLECDKVRALVSRGVRCAKE